MLKIVLYKKIRYKLKVSAWTTYFFIIPYYQKSEKMFRDIYLFSWLIFGIVIEVPHKDEV